MTTRYRPHFFLPILFSLPFLTCAIGCKNKAENTNKASESTSARKEDDSRLQAIKKLEAIGYVDGVQEARSATSEEIPIHIPSKAHRGYNLYCSGHDTAAILMDMEGATLHKWRLPLTRAWPKFEETTEQQSTGFWRRVHLYEDGSLLALFEGIVLIKIDKNSRLIWQYRQLPHHDFFVQENGQIIVLSRKAIFNEEYNEKKPILEDFISILDENGKEKKRISILEAIENSDYRPLLHEYRYRRSAGDLLHTNTLEVLDGTLSDRIGAFRRGNILLSILNLDTIAVLDPEQQKIVWAITGLTQRQHQPTLLPNGRILVFDNHGVKLVRFESKPRNYFEHRDAMAEGGAKSRILEVDPLSQNITWRYEGSEAVDFYSYDCGSLQPLPNGNLLVTESNAGRAFELTRAGRIVWEFRSPHRARRHKQRTANLFEMLRIDEEFVRSWLVPGS